MMMPPFLVNVRLVDDLIGHWVSSDKFVIAGRVLQFKVEEVGIILGVPYERKTDKVVTQQRSKQSKRMKGLDLNEDGLNVPLLGDDSGNMNDEKENL